MSIFEIASRKKLRFESARGELTTEQLWDLPLQAKNQFDLDNVAKTANANLKAVTEDSFVATNSNPAKADCELRLEIVKHVIAVRLAENKAAAERTAKAEKRQKLLAALAAKEEQAITGMSKEDIEKELAALDA